jgi:hypothetical protein
MKKIFSGKSAANNNNNNNNNNNKFFIHLRAELKSQWPVTESARIQNNNENKHMGKIHISKKPNQLRLFKFKCLEIYID